MTWLEPKFIEKLVKTGKLYLIDTGELIYVSPDRELGIPIMEYNDKKIIIDYEWYLTTKSMGDEEFSHKIADKYQIIIEEYEIDQELLKTLSKYIS